MTTPARDESRARFAYQNAVVDTTHTTNKKQSEQQRDAMEIVEYDGDPAPAVTMWTNAGEYRDFDDRTYSTEHPPTA